MKFQERGPWWGGDLQTIRNFIVSDIKSLPGKSRQLIFTTSDESGDHLIATLDEPLKAVEGPIVLLIHGLGGFENSSYVKASSAFHLNRGRRVLRLNLRGAGPSIKTCNNHYHGGHIIDIMDALAALDDELKSAGVFLVGFSLGGNILLNYLAAHDDIAVVGGASVSASIFPEQAALRLLAPRNAIYQKWLLGHVKKESLERHAQLTETEKATIINSKSIYDFDDKVTAPQNGFKDAPDYYHQTNSARKIKDIKVPTLMIHARNDPWIPSDPYEKLMIESPEHVSVLLTQSGGHVGFHEKGFAETFYDRAINDFILSLK